MEVFVFRENILDFVLEKVFLKFLCLGYWDVFSLDSKGGDLDMFRRFMWIVGRGFFLDKEIKEREYFDKIYVILLLFW